MALSMASNEGIEVKAFAIGNSIAVILPAQICQLINVKEGTKFNFTLNGDMISLKPKNKLRDIADESYSVKRIKTVFKR